MPPTVKSLEERIDDLADDVGGVKTQLAVLINNQSTTQAQLASVVSGLATTQAQLASVTARLEAVTDSLGKTIDRLDATNARLDTIVTKFDERLDAAAAKTNVKIEAATTRMETRFEALTAKIDEQATQGAAFRAKTDTLFSITKWIGAFAATALLTVIVSAFSVVRSAGNLESRIDQQQKVLDEIKQDLKEQRTKAK